MILPLFAALREIKGLTVSKVQTFFQSSHGVFIGQIPPLPTPNFCHKCGSAIH